MAELEKSTRLTPLRQLSPLPLPVVTAPDIEVRGPNILSEDIATKVRLHTTRVRDNARAIQVSLIETG